jgi:hypothetical protein
MRPLPRSRRYVVLIAVATAATIALACNGNDEPSCYAGDSLACACEVATGTVSGYRACDVPRRAYGACLCDGTTPGVDAAAVLPGPSVDAADASAKRAFLEACAADAECETGLCYPFNAKGMRCTRRCTADTQATACLPPSTGCNNQGVCKVP